MKTYIAQILSLAKDVKLLGSHSYPHARLLTSLFLDIERKVDFGQISHISYSLLIVFKALNPVWLTNSISKIVY